MKINEKTNISILGQTIDHPQNLNPKFWCGTSITSNLFRVKFLKLSQLN